MNSTRDAGAQRGEALGDLLAEHLGHHDVGQQHVDLAGVLVGQLQRLGPAGRDQHLVAVLGEDPPRHLEQRRLVLDDEDRLAAAARGLARRRRRPLPGRARRSSATGS